MPKLFTTGEAADYLNVSEQTVRAYIKQGLLEARRPKRRWLIPETALQTFVNRSQGGGKAND